MFLAGGYRGVWIAYFLGGWRAAWKGDGRESFTQAAEADRLAEIPVHAGGDGGVAVFLEDIRGERDDEGAMGAWVVADAAGGFESVHDWHLDIEKNDVVGMGRAGADGFEAVGDDIRLDAETAEEKADDLLVGDIILGDEDLEVSEALGFKFIKRLGIGSVRSDGGGKDARENSVNVRGPDRLGADFVEACADFCG